MLSVAILALLPMTVFGAGLERTPLIFLYFPFLMQLILVTKDNHAAAGKFGMSGIIITYHPN